MLYMNKIHISIIRKEFNKRDFHHNFINYSLFLIALKPKMCIKTWASFVQVFLWQLEISADCFSSLTYFSINLRKTYSRHQWNRELKVRGATAKTDCSINFQIQILQFRKSTETYQIFARVQICACTYMYLIAKVSLQRVRRFVVCLLVWVWNKYLENTTNISSHLFSLLTAGGKVVCCTFWVDKRFGWKTC